MRIKYTRKRLFFVMYRSPQARNQGGRSLPKKFFPLLENYSPPCWCPKLVTGLEVQQTFSFPFSLLRHYQIPECFYVNNCGF